MFKLISVLALPFLIVVPGFAQTKMESTECLRFAVVEKWGSMSENWGVWPEDATNWWREDGKKKFPELCEKSRGEADFVLVWQRKWTTERHSVMKLQDMQPFGPRQSEWDCTMDRNNEYHCTLVPPLAQVEWEDFEERVERISVTVNRVHRDTLVPVKSVVKRRGKAGKKSMDSALKFLRKEARKFAASNARP